MNIYIYGSKSFKKDVHDELDHSNIKFKLDDNSSIIDINSLNELKTFIEHNEDDIFLIDDAKIIKKDAFNGKFKSKLKFLIPKDGIEEEYLFENGIGDISFDSIDELSKHITSKIDEQNQEEASEEFDDLLENRDEIQDSISEIVNDAYEEDDSIKLNDELSGLLVSNEERYEDEKRTSSSEPIELEKYNAFDFENELSEIEDPNITGQTIDDLMHLDISNDDFESSETVSKKKKSLNDEPSDLESEPKELNIPNNAFDDQSLNLAEDDLKSESTQGDYDMMEDFSSLDDISENDIMAALNGEEVSINDTQVLTSVNKSSESVSLNLSNTDDISELLSKLLKNKTLEITVKIRE